MGKEFLEFIREVAPEARLILFVPEDAEPFYQKLRFHLHERGYQLKAGREFQKS